MTNSFNSSSTPATDARVLGKDGFVRIRYWPLFALFVYAAINVATATTLMFGSHSQVASGYKLDPFWNAPIIWLKK